ncbi:MAG: STAS-like domain-containing protein [Flavobacteriales bacterium]|nr:STAS-like domain-containing protein [Flavobacteriales bacterium]
MGVYRDRSIISFVDLKSPRDPGYFISQIYRGGLEGIISFQLDFTKVETVFPNSAVPIAGLIEYYKMNGIVFDIIGLTEIVDYTGILNSIVPQSHDELISMNVLNRIFKFSNSNEVHWIVNGFIKAFEKSDVFEKGVLQGLQWCINESMDNVLLHSGQEVGYVMAQIHKTSKHVALTVFDSGQGIYNSLRASPHRPRHAIDALTLSLQERVTRDRNIGQGNGMFGLRRVIEFNEGRLALTSHSASYLIQGREARTFDKIPFPSRDRACTTVDIQLDYGREVSIAEALMFDGQSYIPVDMRFEAMEDEHGQIRYCIQSESEGFGTRMAAARARNDIMNLINSHSGVVLLDFEGIELISSSYADEFVGKLVVMFGFVGFNQRFRLVGMSSLVQGIVHRSVAMRLAETFQSGMGSTS